VIEQASEWTLGARILVDEVGFARRYAQLLVRDMGRRLSLVVAGRTVGTVKEQYG
jgi:hypothetical protein